MNAIRIWAISSNVFREIFRERVMYLTGLFGVGFILAVSFLNEVSVGTEAKISLDVGLAGMTLVGLAVSAFVGGGLIRKEIDKRTALILISKPLSRAEFIIGKHLGITFILTTLLAIMTLIYMSVLSWRAIPYPTGSLLISVAYIALELSLIAAVAIMFGVFTSGLIATILTITVYVMGHFSSNLLELSRTVETANLKIFIQALYLIFPDLSRLNLKNQAVYGLLPDQHQLIINGVYGVVYIVMILAIASFLFNRRQF